MDGRQLKGKREEREESNKPLTQRQKTRRVGEQRAAGGEGDTCSEERNMQEETC